MTLASVLAWLVMAFSVAGTMLFALIAVPYGIAARMLPQTVPVVLRVLISFSILVAALRLFTFLWPGAAILALFALWMGIGIHLFWFFKSANGLERTIAAMLMGGTLLGVTTALRETTDPWPWLVFKASMHAVA